VKTFSTFWKNFAHKSGKNFPISCRKKGVERSIRPIPYNRLSNQLKSRTKKSELLFLLFTSIGTPIATSKARN
jgi:hypothetical protein